MTRVRVFAIDNFTSARKPVFDNYGKQVTWFEGREPLFDGDVSYIPGKRLVLSSIDVETATHVVVEWKNRDIYYRVLDLIYTTAGNVELVLELDPWLTYKYQNNLTVGFGHIQRAKMGSRYYDDPVLAPYYETSIVDTFGSVKGAFLCACITNTEIDDGEESKIMWYWRDLPSSPSISYMDIEPFISGKWVYDLDLAPDHVLGAWYVPFRKEDLVISSHWLSAGNGWFKSEYPDTDVYEATISAKSTKYDTFVVTSWTGYEHLHLPIGLQVTKIYFALSLNPSGAKLKCWYGDSKFETANSAGQACFIPLEAIDVIMDDWTIYLAGQRDLDIEGAGLERVKQLSSSLTSIVPGAVGGGMMGGMTGKTSLMGLGAVAGAVGGVAGSAIEYGVSSWLDPKIQSLTDRGKMVTANELSVTSSHAIEILMTDHTRSGHSRPLNLIKKSVPSQAVTRISTDITNNGDYCDEYGIGESYLASGVLQGDFEILGSAPASAKIAIAEAIRGGVRTVKL